MITFDTKLFWDPINKANDFIDVVGWLGPFIIMTITIYFLWNQKYLYGYLIFYIFATFTNTVLKNIFKQARPTNGRSIMNEDYSGVQQYGMPSYHAQLSFFSIAYLYLVKKSTYLLIIQSFIALITMYQRWLYRRHTVEQLCVGMIVGIAIGYFGYFITTRFLETNKYIK
jgi:PAP2 superfamily